MKKYTVLAVDDDPRILKMILRILGTSTYRIVTAPDAEFALNILEQLNVDLIISDYLMPELSGLEFLKIVNRDNPLIPSILQTGFADFPLAKTAMNETGVAVLLEKPWTPDQLIHAVNRALATYEARSDKETLKDIVCRNDFEEPANEMEHSTNSADIKAERIERGGPPVPQENMGGRTSSEGVDIWS